MFVFWSPYLPRLGSWFVLDGPRFSRTGTLLVRWISFWSLSDPDLSSVTDVKCLRLELLSFSLLWRGRKCWQSKQSAPMPRDLCVCAVLCACVCGPKVLYSKKISCLMPMAFPGRKHWNRVQWRGEGGGIKSPHPPGGAIRRRKSKEKKCFSFQ